MSWASKRRTTRMEDEAYCLLGIFGISMPLLYGEGWRAFHRLQEEIMKQTEDYSIFLWTEGRLALRTNFGVFAPSPSSFCEGSLKNFGKTYLYRDINSVFLSRGLARKILPQSSVSGNPSQMTPRGLYINTFARKYGKKTQLWTGCIHGEVYLCIEIHIIRDDGFSQYGRTGMPNFKWFVEAREAQHFELSEFYLNTDENYGLRRAASTHFTGLPIPIQPGFQQKVVLSSRCTESITYIDAFPPMIANEIFSCTEDQQVISLKGEKGSYTVQDTTFSLRFKVFHAITKSLIDHFIVSFGVQGQSSWCTVVEILASGLSSLEDAGTRCFKLGKLREWMCDRSIERLPSGRVIHVATKFTSSKDGIRGKAEPVCYTLHITLLEGKSKPNAWRLNCINADFASRLILGKSWPNYKARSFETWFWVSEDQWWGVWETWVSIQNFLYGVVRFWLASVTIPLSKRNKTCLFITRLIVQDLTELSSKNTRDSISWLSNTIDPTPYQKILLRIVFAALASLKLDSTYTPPDWQSS